MAAFPQFNPTQVLSALQKGAAQLGSTVPDPAFGYGRIDAQGALNTVPGPHDDFVARCDAECGLEQLSCLSVQRIRDRN